MTDILAQREALAQSPAVVLERLPMMGRVMLTAESGGATHERIGAVEKVTIEASHAQLGGASHDSRLDLSAVTSVIADRSGRMGDKAMPRLDFLDGEGRALYSIIGLEGLEPFDETLLPLGAGVPQPPREKPAPSERSESPSFENDNGALVFAALSAAGAQVSIELRRDDLIQRWRGTPPEPRHAMGFVNVMQGDFHLHLKAGAVARWRGIEIGDEIELFAEDGEGEPAGLVIRGPRSVLSEFSA